MNTFLFTNTEIECCIFCFFLFSQRAQILKQYKNGQYCTPLSQADCRYFIRVSDKTYNNYSNFNKIVIIFCLYRTFLNITLA